MDDLRIFKQKQINDYISSVDLSEINTDKMAYEISKIIGEKQAIRLNYKKQELINEAGEKSGKILEKIESITVISTYEKEIDGKTYFFPSEETYLIG